MNIVSQHNIQKQTALFGCGVMMISLVYSPFLLSVGMIIVMLSAALDMEALLQNFQLRKNPLLQENFQKFKQRPVFLVLLLYFFLVLLGGLYTSDFTYWLTRLKMKLPFLLLPFAFLSMPTLDRKTYLGFYYLLVIVLFVTCIGIGFNYLINYDAINEMIHHGQSMPVPRNHIRFSLLMAIGVVAGVYLYLQKYTWKYQWERHLILGMTLFLLFFIHVLSVRSGILVLYVSLALLAIIYTYQSKRYGLGLAGLVLVVSLPILAYIFIPSFHTKVSYTIYDRMMYERNEGENYSDSERILSLQLGTEIAKEHPLLGVGSGDLKMEMQQKYERLNIEEEKMKMPHNQLISVLASHGLIGLGVFLFAFFFPLFHNKNYRHPLFLSIHIIIFISFMMENTIENSMGLGIYIFWILLGLKYLDDKVE